MADTAVRAQAFPAATTLTDLFTAAGNVTIGTLDACNHSDTAADMIRVSIAYAAAADAAKQYVVGGNTAAGLSLDAHATAAFTRGWTLQSGDVIRVYSTNGTTSFNVSGIQWA